LFCSVRSVKNTWWLRKLKNVVGPSPARVTVLKGREKCRVFLKRVAKKCLILKELLKEQRALRYSAEWGGKVGGTEGSAKHAGAI
jgi:hypothetical protein